MCVCGCVCVCVLNLYYPLVRQNKLFALVGSWDLRTFHSMMWYNRIGYDRIGWNKMEWDGMGYHTIPYHTVRYDTLYCLGVQVLFTYCLCTEELKNKQNKQCLGDIVQVPMRIIIHFLVDI